MAPVELNIVCFRYRADDANRVNGDIVIDIQESGIAAPSTTLLDGELAIRAAIVHNYDFVNISGNAFEDISDGFFGSVGRDNHEDLHSFLPHPLKHNDFRSRQQAHRAHSPMRGARPILQPDRIRLKPG